MCGIVGFIGKGNPIQAVIDGLRKLEYRGYDSAGIGWISKQGLKTFRSVGRVDNLSAGIDAKSDAGLAIGHTRWATHGRPAEENAHPHLDPAGKIAVVHNGIIENWGALRAEMEALGNTFRSETDTEVIAHLVAREYAEGCKGDLLKAVEKVLPRLDGTFALGIIAADQLGLIVAARRGSPLVLGLGDGFNMIASDAMPIAPFTKKVVYLDDNQAVALRPGSVEVRKDGKKVDCSVAEISSDIFEAGKDGKAGYAHFMLKEIHEQPAMLERLVRTRILDHGQAGAPGTPPRFNLDGLRLTPEYMRDISRVILIAQGTAYHACMVGRNLIERAARLPAFPEFASDFRYRDPILDPSVLVIAVTQSGETLDTLEGVRLARQAGCRVLSVVNVPGSSIARESDDVFLMDCGPEIGVASTKAFTSMIASLYIIAMHLGLSRGTLSPAEARRRVADLGGVGARCESVLTTQNYIKQIARKYKDARNFLFLGRGTGWPLAMEGALKLKEVSYIHAEGYNAAEMKHGPIALIDENMPVLVIALKGRRYEKIIGNIQEVKARRGQVIAIASHDDDQIANLADDVIYIRSDSGIMNSILCSVPLQLLAYYIADLRGCDVDKPKNLAKSVTVE